MAPPSGTRKMTTFLRTISSRFTTPSASSSDLTSLRSDGLLTAKTPAGLFPTTTAEVDGEDCLHDCESCTIHLPRKWEIDEDDKLYGNIKGWQRHLLVATGKTDWVRDVEDEKGSVMEAVGKAASAVEGGRLMLSASNIPLPDGREVSDGNGMGIYGSERRTSVLVLPAWKWVDGVRPGDVEGLIKSVVNTAPTNTSSLVAAHTNGTSNGAINGTTNGTTSNGDAHPSPATPSPPLTLPTGLSLRPCTHKYLILLCSQATRDARCGQSAPLIRRELERHLRPLNLYRDLHDTRPGGVGIYFISHVGGHKYSANMMVYRQAEGEEVEGAGQCIWLARVRPEDCENIVRYTVLQGKVVKPERQLRGGFDRERGVVSW
ncbi:hypothetical protein B0A48_05510 [Cryoendolithus antarcticus]|uniref:Actin patches distal protein 1 n=1 Tax=Cryoendolithus antarcticus TaxID=1507870 RepID=A0A1V8TIY5_9PEZI|nr:hypothetical protein B0A48_05510 [Cryoendolithus antarcticus]